ncbi:hypothetical protein B0H13DRAFT_1884531 [Mycena leptocephala]|nr:hypothetical protein B0H13DRAFT_1884531 [Mycena leptocephala]
MRDRAIQSIIPCSVEAGRPKGPPSSGHASRGSKKIRISLSCLSDLPQARMEGSYKHYERWFDAVFMVSQVTNFREYARPGHQPADSVRGWVDSRSQNCASDEQRSRAADSDVIELRIPGSVVPEAGSVSGRIRDCEMETQDDETSWMFMVIGTKLANRGNQQKAG